jgi:hypothetical protein
MTTSLLYEGLAVGLNTVGGIDLGVANLGGADSFVDISVADDSTVATGYLVGEYITMSFTGAYTTGSTQLTGLAIDATYTAATVGCELQGVYLYLAGSGSNTLTSANVNGLNIYVDDLGGNPARASAIQLHWADDGTGSSALLYIRMEGASAAVGAFVEFGGTAALAPTYFLKSNGVSGSMYYGGYTATAVTGIGLRCSMGGSIYYIPLIATTSAS